MKIDRETRINEVANAITAYEWKNGIESQFTYCVDLLGITAHAPYAFQWVDALEKRFEQINAGVENRLAEARSNGTIDF